MFSTLQRRLSTLISASINCGVLYQIINESDGLPLSTTLKRSRTNEDSESQRKRQSLLQLISLFHDNLGEYARIRVIERKEGEPAFWVKESAADGRTNYFNTMTGISTIELPPGSHNIMTTEMARRQSWHN
jgi:hypothetical protein